MNYKENLIRNLQLYKIIYTDNDNDEIEIILKPFIIKVKFENKNISILPIITGWNQVTDFMQMKFENSLIYLSLKLFVYLIALSSILYKYNEFLNNYSVFVLLSIVFLFISIKFTFFINYLIKFENFKKSIIAWTLS